MRLLLSSGVKVEVPIPLMDHLVLTYPRGTPLVFVERRGRVLSYVQWAGTEEEAEAAVADGTLRRNEV